MKFFRVILILLFFSCKGEIKQKETVNETIALQETIDLEVYDYEGLEPLINQNKDKTYVVNFWATWCAPCIKELPYFEAINEKYNESVAVLLVSLDFPNQYEKKLKPYIKKHNLKSRVVALNDTDMNTWIPKINKDWSGAIPATIIYNKSKRQFYEQSFTYEELETQLKQFIK